jgi:hypothetical protein
MISVGKWSECNQKNQIFELKSDENAIKIGLMISAAKWPECNQNEIDDFEFKTDENAIKWNWWI